MFARDTSWIEPFDSQGLSSIFILPSQSPFTFSEWAVDFLATAPLADCLVKSKIRWLRSENMAATFRICTRICTPRNWAHLWLPLSIAFVCPHIELMDVFEVLDKCIQGPQRYTNTDRRVNILSIVILFLSINCLLQYSQKTWFLLIPASFLLLKNHLDTNSSSTLFSQH